MKCNWRGGVECTVSRVVSTELACLAWLEETEVCLCNSSEQVLQSLFRSALTPHSPHTIHEIFDVTELSLFTKIYNKYIAGHSNGLVQSVVSIFSIKIHKLSV